MAPLSTILKKKRAQRDAGIISNDEEKKLDLLYRKGPAAYGSITNLQKASKLPRKKVEAFWRTKMLTQITDSSAESFHVSKLSHMTLMKSGPLMLPTLTS